MGTVPYDGQARQPNILAPCIIFSVVSPLAVALRFYSRRLAGVGTWWDDWAVLVALPPAIGFNILMLWGLSVGFGAYPSPDRAKHLPQFFQALYTSEILYNTALPFIKISILLLYRRVFPTPFMIKAVWVLGGINLLWFLGTEPTIIFQCTPIRKAWDDKLPGTCFHLREFLLGQAISSVIIDCATVCLPIRLVLALQMPLKRRLLVCGIFLVGIFAVTCSIIRIPYIIGTLTDDTPYTDLYVFEPGNIWSLAELHVALVCACLPTIHPIFTRIRASRSKANATSYPYNGSGYRRTGSTSKGVDNNVKSLASNDSERGIIADHAGRNITSAYGTEDVELGDLTYPSRRGAHRPTGSQEIGMRKEVNVFTDANKAFA